jgi:diphthamide biosynthesis enzyme Dph1/Dph2-like protein
MYVEARKKEKLNLEKLEELEKKLPPIIYMAYSIQYKELAEDIKKNIRKKVTGFSQVLGCSKIKTSSPILLISSGRFHALNLALQGNKVYIFDNFSIKEIDSKEIESIKMKEKAKYLKLLASDNIGILVSTKNGQENFKLAEKIKIKIEKKGKNASIFIADNINLNELENFSCDIWINTACPGLSLDSDKIINQNYIKF